MSAPRVPSRPAQRVAGFTLVELIVTVAVAAVLVTVAVPAMQQSLGGRATSSAADELANVLRVARTESMKRGTSVSVCSSASPNASSPSCSGSASWTTGWLLFVDWSGNGSIDAVDKVIKVFSPAGAISTITEDNGDLYVSFRPNGISGNSSARFVVSPAFSASASGYSDAQRTVCLSSVGRVTLLKGSASCP